MIFRWDSEDTYYFCTFSWNIKNNVSWIRYSYKPIFTEKILELQHLESVGWVPTTSEIRSVTRLIKVSSISKSGSSTHSISFAVILGFIGLISWWALHRFLNFPFFFWKCLDMYAFLPSFQLYSLEFRILLWEQNPSYPKRQYMSIYSQSCYSLHNYQPLEAKELGFLDLPTSSSFIYYNM